MRRTNLTVAGVVLAFTSTAACALPGAATSGSTPQSSMVEQVNGNHSACNKGPAGWHYHYRGERIACGGRPSGRFWGWQLREGRWGWWNSRERRWN
jgi:hypothetical protein